MSPNQIRFFLIITAFLVASFIVYFELNRRDISNFSEGCSTDTDCANGLKCLKNQCVKN
jgi:hypothetical protein